MKAYRLGVNLKLGLIVFAVLIAVLSLAYTNHLVNRMREREQAIIRIWAGAQEQLVRAPAYNPYQEPLAAFEGYLGRSGAGPLPGMDSLQAAALREAVAWAQTMPPADQVNFIVDHIIVPNPFGIPAIVTDSASGRPLQWRNVAVSDTTTARADTLRLMRRAAEMAEVYPPIPIELGYGLKQYVQYDESSLIRELRIYPYLQLFFVGLFILVGYLGFSYVRRSEQSSLWVGMAREAAHQLGTPISSLMGWLELLRLRSLGPAEEEAALDEVEKDIERLRRVANRFSDIGSLPKLEVMAVAPVIANTADYMHRRFPRQGKHVALEVQADPQLQAPLNAELFEWVIENLLKNALDAIDRPEGLIEVAAYPSEDRIRIDVRDTGKGIDRRQWKNVFRPGYSTKKRGWGLGLSLAKRIVEDYHGGTLVLAHSKVGQGTTFRIELPRADGVPEEVPGEEDGAGHDPAGR